MSFRIPRSMRVVFVLLLLVPAGLAVRPSSLIAQDAKQEAKHYERLLKSSTWIVMPRPGTKPGVVDFREGSGWLLDASKPRLIVTNEHVVRNEDKVQVFFPQVVRGQLITDRKAYTPLVVKGQGIPGKVIATDAKRDLAVVQLAFLPQGALPLQLAGDEADGDDRVYTLGNPGGDKLWAFVPSKILAVGKRKFPSSGKEETRTLEAWVIETDDATSKKGQSGSLLVNQRLEVVGVMQGGTKKDPQTTYFIDKSELKALLEENKITAKIAPPKKSDSAKSPKLSMQQKVIAWVRVNNDFATNHPMVEETAKRLEQLVGPDKGFVFRLGDALLKSHKQTLLCGWGGDLFIFELSAAQARTDAVNPKSYTLTGIADPSRRGPLEVGLVSPKIDGGDNLDRNAPITGSVLTKLLQGKQSLKGDFALRLTYAAGGKRFFAFHAYPGQEFLPAAKPLSFKFASFTSAAAPPGLVVAVLELVRNPRTKDEVVISAPAAVLLHVVAAADGK